MCVLLRLLWTHQISMDPKPNAIEKNNHEAYLALLHKGLSQPFASNAYKIIFDNHIFLNYIFQKYFNSTHFETQIYCINLYGYRMFANFQISNLISLNKCENICFYKISNIILLLYHATHRQQYRLNTLRENYF